MSRFFFIGPCGGGGTPTNGASAKNFQIVHYFKNRGIDISIIDTEKWKKNPLVLLRLFFSLFAHHGCYIVSANNTSSFRLLSILTKMPLRHFVAYWVIGGSIADWIKDGRVSAEPFKKVDFIMCEGERMKKVFLECGIEKVKVVPNFKVIDFIPEKSLNKKEEIRFVFLSRIIKDKGVGIIIDAVKALNKRKTGYFVDFYGPFEDTYKEEFTKAIEVVENISYKGFLNLNDTKNYNVLAKYDVMLFPTYWHGEGFPGIFIDAFIAGLPVIATDWSMNKELIQDGENGWIIPPHDSEALANAMEKVLEDRVSLKKMAKACQDRAFLYDINQVINDKLLKRLNLCD
jgi:glycosyltransferase involved in cell wall biosynthesis